MRCNLYANETLVGWAELSSTDPPMGRAGGTFYPNDNYGKIRTIVREYHLYDGTLGEANAQKRLEAEAKIAALRLTVVTEDGERLEPTGGVQIDDFSEEVDEEPYQLDVLGLTFETFDRLFPTAWEEYLNQVEGKEQG